MKKHQAVSAWIGIFLSLPLHAQEHAHPLPAGDATATKGAESAPISGMNGMEHAMPMRGMLGPYPMTREASGTSWQPDATPMTGIHSMTDPWSIMWQGFVNVIYDHQGGPRGDTKTFSQSMLMGMGQRPLAGGMLGLRGMISLDPLMGKGGYPLLFQTGETADGQTPLIDRQHPHDLFMELAATYSRPLAADRAVFAYIGLPGEPALGPATFMHRFSGMDNPETPLTHHWLDSTHITFGVVTLGHIWRNVKVEGSAFNGREPDQKRWNIETRKLDSSSARLSWNPTPALSLQISHGRLDRPDSLEPDVSVRRTAASAIHQYKFGANRLQTTLAWGRNRKQPGQTTDGWLLESALKLHGQYTLFGRLERVENDELFREGEPLHRQAFKVGKLSVGAIREITHAGHARISVGALVSRYAVPSALDGVYGSQPMSYMVFLRARFE